MSRLRQRIAGRLKEAQNTAALLTTFNEVDMSAVIAARARYRDDFEKRHGVRLGFMSFFVKAAIAAQPENPASYDGLAEIYNAQRQFDDAAEASAEAARLSGGGSGGDSATSVFDQGLIFWNAGRLAEARQQFERTLEIDSEHGEAHYWLGMANLNAGQIAEAAAEFTLYLDREPDGRFAEQAGGILTQIQP